MENIYKLVKKEILIQVGYCIRDLALPQNTSLEKISAEVPKNKLHGDIATNAAMIIAQQTNKNAVEIANLIAARLKKIDYIKSVSIASPPFINITIKEYIWQNIVKTINQKKLAFGNSDLGHGKKINIEFVSANPTGPLHLGNARGAIIGDVLARVLKKTGYEITREYYINDAGKQIDELAGSVHLRYLECLGQEINEPITYPGEYIAKIAKELAEKYPNALAEEKEWMGIIKKHAVKAIMKMIKQDLKDLGVDFDLFVSESDIHNSGRLQESLAILQSKGLIYEGKLPAPKGKLPEDWEPREQVLFRSTDYGDDIDRPLKKSDDSWTYFASDIAYHLDKIKRGFSHMILEIGKDHGGYKKRMQAAVFALSGGNARIDVLFHDIVNLYKNNIAIKMSKRAGKLLTVQDVLELVDKDSLKIIMLLCKSDMVINFDIEKTKEQSKENIIFYIQYACARTSSVISKTKEYIGESDLSDAQGSLLSLPEELSIIKMLAYFPHLVEKVALTYEPHKIVFYLYEVASQFHSLWNSGRDNELKKFIFLDDISLTIARLSLVTAIKNIIHCGLNLLNIEPLEKM
jgi:arginyl-tRNA synthetase